VGTFGPKKIPWLGSGKQQPTLQNFIYKHTTDLKNVPRNKKKEKGEFEGHQVGTT
jgi:hypothetical protein